MKKVVNSVLASALALTVAPMVVGAEEATQAPAVDPGLEKVVKRLEALKLIQGYGNGDFGVERSITRAEFATLVVRAKGLEEGAKLAQFQSNFVDVKPADWFAGYVNVASGQEIVKGYNDQTFKAGNNVTYAEAVAMIIRALGYDPAVKGVWPNNYIAKASELGISKGVKVTADKAATRGDIFIMLDNALTVGLMKQVEYGTDIRFEIYDGKNNNAKKTLLSEFLNVKVYDMDWVNEGGNKNNELPFVSNVPVMGLGTLKANQVSFSAGLKGTYKVADGINVNGFAGQHVQVWVKDEREDSVVWMENSENEDVVNARTDTAYLDGKIQKSGANLKKDSDLKDVKIMFDNGKTYKLSRKSNGDVDTKVVYNFKTYDALEGLKLIFDVNNDFAVSAKIVLNDDNEISYISVLDDASADKNDAKVKYGSSVIEKVDATKQRITNLTTGSFDLKDKEEGTDFLVYLNGQLAKFADLQPMDVYSVYYPQGQKDKYIVMASRNVVEGKVEKVEARTNGDNRLVIGDKTYRVRATSYSENANKDVETPTGDKLRDTLRDLDGVEVKLYLGADGRARHIETKDNVNDRRFKAVITKDAVYDTSNDKYAFSVYTEKGATQKISVDLEDVEFASNGNELTDAQAKKWLTTIQKDNNGKFVDGTLTFVEVTLNSKGEVDKVKVLDDVEYGKLAGDDWDKAADEDGLILSTKDKNGKKQSYEADNAIVFDMTGKIKTSGNRNQLEDARIAKFKSVADDDDKTVYYLTDDNDLDYVFVVDGSSVENASEYGYIKNMYVTGGDDTIVFIKKDGTDVKEVTYKLDGAVKDAQKRFNRFDFVQFSLNSDDEVIISDVTKIMDGKNDDAPAVTVIGADKYDAADLDDVVKGKVVDVDGNKVTVEYTVDGAKQKETVYVNSATAYMNTDWEILSGVNEDDYVVMVETDDDDSRFDYVVVVTDQDEVDEEDYDMAKFLAFDGKTPPDNGGDNIADWTKVSAAVKATPLGQNYTITGKVGAIDFKQVDKVEVKLGARTYEVELNEDGSFEYSKTVVGNALTQYTLIITPTKGDVIEKVIKL